MAMLPWWIHYPNVNNEILNLDWILQISNENTDKIENFIGVNTIKYADPILWDITSQYEANTIVVDPQTGDAYISTKAVPYGVALSNDTYWTRIYNYANALNVLKKAVTKADEGDSTFASTSYSTGDSLWLNDVLYLVIRPIASGDGFITDVDNNPNIQSRDLEDLIHFVHFMIANRDYGYLENSSSALSKGEYIWWKNALCIVTADIPVNGALEGSVESTTIAAELVKINRRFSTTLTLNNLEVSGSTELKGTSVDGNLEVSGSTELKGTSIDGNLEVSGDIDITGTYKQNGQALDTKYSKLQGKKILIFGDSIIDPNSTNCYHPNWAEQLVDELTDIADITINGVSGRTMVQLPNILDALGSTYLSQFDIFIIALGTNDCGTGVEFATSYTAEDNTKFNCAVLSVWNKLKNANAEALQYWMTPIFRIITSNQISMQAYRECIKAWAKAWKTKLIAGDMVNGINYISVNNLGWYNDGTHPAQKGATAIYKHVLNSLLIEGDSTNDDNVNLVKNITPESNFSGTMQYYFDGPELHLQINGVVTGNLVNNIKIADLSALGGLHNIKTGGLYELVSAFDQTDSVFRSMAVAMVGSSLYARLVDRDDDATHPYQIKCELVWLPTAISVDSLM